MFSSINHEQEHDVYFEIVRRLSAAGLLLSKC
jgi:hypothetical protein